MYAIPVTALVKYCDIACDSSWAILMAELNNWYWGDFFLYYVFCFFITITFLLGCWVTGLPSIKLIPQIWTSHPAIHPNMEVPGKKIVRQRWWHHHFIPWCRIKGIWQCKTGCTNLYYFTQYIVCVTTCNHSPYWVVSINPFTIFIIKVFYYQVGITVVSWSKVSNHSTRDAQSTGHWRRGRSRATLHQCTTLKHMLEIVSVIKYKQWRHYLKC